MISIAIVSPDKAASTLLESAQQAMGPQPGVAAVDLRARAATVEILAEEIRGAIARSLNGPPQSLLLLTDVIGSSATGACRMLAGGFGCPVEVVTGVNLPMIFSALANRDRLDLKRLAEKAVLDGQKGIRNAEAFSPARPGD